MLLNLLLILFQFWLMTVEPAGCRDGFYVFEATSTEGGTILMQWWTDNEDGWLYITSSETAEILTTDPHLYLQDRDILHPGCDEADNPNPPQLVLVVLVDPALTEVVWNCGGSERWVQPVELWPLYNEHSDSMAATPVSVLVLDRDSDLNAASCHVEDLGPLWYTYGYEQIYCLAGSGKLCTWLGSADTHYH
jgi:hypothetical protein